MQRYFAQFTKNEKYVRITGEDYHHIKNVMRMKINDQFYLSNGEQVFYVTITEFTSDTVIVELLYENIESSELKIFVAIAQGMPKSDKFDFIVQKSTELGASEIIPVLSERSLIKVDQKSEKKKTDRYQKIAESAAKQSQRLIIPKVRDFMTLKEVINYSKDFQYKCVAYEASGEKEQYNLHKVLNSIKENEKLLVFIGPEGGISEKELSLLTVNGFQLISLGKRILRTETAPLFIMSAITYELELKG